MVVCILDYEITKKTGIMKTTDHKKIQASVPVNMDTVRVTLFKGVHYKHANMYAQPHWDLSPKIKDHPDKKLEKELIGVKFGRMEVIGYLGKFSKRKNTGGLWCVRCDCGKFEARSAKAIRNTKNNKDCCQYCRGTENSKRQSQYLAYGRNF